MQTETTVTRTYLYITVAHKTAEEMADKYNFNADQRKQLYLWLRYPCLLKIGQKENRGA
ncbi:MAG: hypothetical protein NC548_65125 [Lachnospiraceae bacterium]|nr:hypothetical protein [Lachnospiraceae bacterium]